MKKKILPINEPDEPIIPEELLELARKSVDAERSVLPAKRCAVCESNYTPMSGPQQQDDLCWVCRRLKISAWRDNDPQAALQE